MDWLKLGAARLVPSATAHNKDLYMAVLSPVARRFQFVAPRSEPSDDCTGGCADVEGPRGLRMKVSSDIPEQRH
jgi:hypothetical protein